MKIIFFGSGKFGLPSLKKLADSNYEIAAIVTAPNRKKGRGWNVQAPPIKAFIEQALPGINILQPEDASNAEFIEILREINADIFVVIDYGQILSKELLEVPKKYSINLHPSLLPKYRGATPLNRAILDGDEATGNTIATITERVDAGDIVLQETTRIREDEDAVELGERLSQNGAELLLKALQKIASNEEEFIKQDENKVLYASKLEKKEGKIDWSRSALDIARRVRGLKPWPGAFTYLDGKMLKILQAQIIDDIELSTAPGTVCDEKEIVVAAGKGAVKILKLQLEGKKAVTSGEFLHGYPLKKGTILG